MDKLKSSLAELFNRLTVLFKGAGINVVENRLEEALTAAQLKGKQILHDELSQLAEKNPTIVAILGKGIVTDLENALAPLIEGIVDVVRDEVHDVLT